MLVGCVWGHSECAGAGECTVYSHPDTAPDHVPDWVTEEVRAPAPVPETEVHLSASTSAPVELTDDDRVHLPKAREYVSSVKRPSVRGLKDYANVGQARAERLLAYLETEES